MPLSWRFSVLGDRHRALGSKLEDWSGMGPAWTYDKDICEEHIAGRTKAVRDLATHRQLEAPLQRAERLGRERGIGHLVHRAPLRLAAFLRLRREGACQLLDQPGEPCLVALQAPDLAAALGHLARQSFHRSRASGALGLELARLERLLALVHCERLATRKRLQLTA